MDHWTDRLCSCGHHLSNYLFQYFTAVLAAPDSCIKNTELDASPSKRGLHRSPTTFTGISLFCSQKVTKPVFCFPLNLYSQISLLSLSVIATHLFLSNFSVIQIPLKSSPHSTLSFNHSRNCRYAFCPPRQSLFKVAPGAEPGASPRPGEPRAAAPPRSPPRGTTNAGGMVGGGVPDRQESTHPSPPP